MKAISWADISEDKDQKYAFSEIVNCCHGFDIKLSERLDLAHVMLAVAVSNMDYEDPLDHTRDITEDAERSQKIRLANFMDFTFEFAGKRLALVQGEDPYLQKRMDEYLLSRKDMRVLQSFAGTHKLDNVDVDVFMNTFEELKNNLLMQGVPRQSLSKAFLDASFVFAKMAPLDEYIAYCDYINMALNPEPQTESQVQIVESNTDVMSEMAFLSMQPASASVH